MKYGITLAVAGFPGFIEIDKAEYERIKTARRNLFEAYFLEQKLDLVTENYYEYERELLSLAARLMIFHDDNPASRSGETILLNRRIVNLLSAAEMYLEQSLQHIENIYGSNSGNFVLVKTEQNIHYDQSLGYRAMGALRNYALHRDVPIHGLKYDYNRIDHGDDFQPLHRVIPLILISELQDDDDFKKTVLRKLQAASKNDWLDIRPLLREYVEGISKIHENARNCIHLDLANWEATLDDTIARFQSQFGKDTSLQALSVVARPDSGLRQEKVPVSRFPIERRHDLESKNSFSVNLHKSYVSNEVRQDDA